MLHHKDPFKISASSDAPMALGQVAKEKDATLPVMDRIKNLISSNKIVLFMKGTSEAPQCGFSANVAKTLNQMGQPYVTYDILADMDMRVGVKEFAKWPTYPQLWVKGELIGGNDIVTELAQNGELENIVNKA